jgi:DNA-binding response OmpR family regulator
MKETINKKILIIEDEKPLAHALELKLTREGFETVITPSGEEGLALLEKETFALVLTDIITNGADGFKILETIQSKKLKTPVVVMTNLNQEEDRKRATDLGATNFFVKSNVTISEIVENVKKLIDRGA